jgi:hypothetical protein
MEGLVSLKISDLEHGLKYRVIIRCTVVNTVFIYIHVGSLGFYVGTLALYDRQRIAMLMVNRIRSL